MRGNVISYIEMCQKEGTSLQRGMNFRLKGRYSVILMSVRPNSPYRDEVQDDGAVLIYEGHDEPKRKGIPNPKAIDQPERQPGGTLTENGKFHQAAQGFKLGRKGPTLSKSMKRSSLEFGQTMVSSTWLIHGMKTTVIGTFSSSNWKQ